MGFAFEEAELSAGDGGGCFLTGGGIKELVGGTGEEERWALDAGGAGGGGLEIGAEKLAVVVEDRGGGTEGGGEGFGIAAELEADEPIEPGPAEEEGVFADEGFQVAAFEGVELGLHAEPPGGGEALGGDEKDEAAG